MKHKACVVVSKESINLINEGKMNKDVIIKQSIKSLIENTNIDDLRKVFKIEEFEDVKNYILEIASSYK